MSEYNFQLDPILPIAKPNMPSKSERVSNFSTSHFETLLLELQRSLDFYQSQLHQAPLVKLYLDPIFKLNEAVIDYLKDGLSLPVEVVDLSARFMQRCHISAEYQLDFFGLLGASAMVLENDAEQEK